MRIEREEKDLERKDWWKKSVVYEIYVKSFKDSNGDGIGDLGGVIEKLDYLKNLEVDVLWLTPIYESPGEDNGYDISDYQSIMECFGTMSDFDQLLLEAHQREMRIVMDLVVNHTSSQHPWFIESRSGKENPYREYYIWQDGEKGLPPNNWTSSFLGSAWKYEEQTEKYYLHLFAESQPDLNWAYKPVRKSIYDMMKWWLDKGIDGFRMDVISLISKDEASYHKDSDVKGHTVCANGPKVHEYLQEMRKEVLDGYDIMTVGETPAVTVDEACRYTSEDGKELDMIFQFELMDVDGGESGKWNDTRFQLKDVKRVLGKWQRGLHGKAWNSLFWNNHDQPRVVSRFGDTSTVEFWKKSAKMLATALYFLQGTPYIYQGEEIGMTNVDFTDIHDFRDIESLRAYEQYVEEEGMCPEQMMHYLRKASRDNGRTPMQWTNEKNAGFSTADPWIWVPSNYKEINVQNQLDDEDSIFNYYKKLLQIRKNNAIVLDGDYTELNPESDAVYSYARTTEKGTLYVFCNFTDQEQKIDETVMREKSNILLKNYEEHDENMLKPYEAIVYEVIKE